MKSSKLQYSLDLSDACKDNKRIPWQKKYPYKATYDLFCCLKSLLMR